MANYTGTADPDNFVGTIGSDTFTSIRGNDTVDGNGGDDVISIDLSYTDASVKYDAVAAATATGTAPLPTMSVRNVGHLGTLLTGGGRDALTIAYAQGSFTWHAGAGMDTLKLDLSAAAAGMNSGISVNGYEVHSSALGSTYAGLATDIERVYVIGSQYADFLSGTAGDDVLKGGSGDDFLAPGSGGKDVIDGDAGFDRLVNANFGDGDTTYDATQAATATGFTFANGTLVKNVEGFSLTTGQGNDTVTVSAAQRDFTWIANGGSDRLVADYSAAAGGITVTWLASTPVGPDLRIVAPGMATNAHADAYSIESVWLTGSAHNDTITGTAGDDRIDGHGGQDTIDGGAGMDTFIADYGAETHAITYDATAAASATGFTLWNGTSVRNVESFDLTTGSGDDMVTVTEANGAFIWKAGNGNDRLVANYSHASGAITVTFEHTHFDTYTLISAPGIADGNHAMALDIEGLNIVGSRYNDSIAGTSFADTLNGGAGADTLAGGLGDDTYYVDNARDVVTEGINAGTDTVISSIGYALGANIENLTLTGSLGINGLGNELANHIIGNSASNVLSGFDGNDILDGKGGADDMIGGLGNDTYYVDNASDVVVEQAGQGTDGVRASISYALGANVENLTLTGTAAINGNGNELANHITGNSAHNVLSGGDGDDVLDGKGGADIMNGGMGNDTFYVDNAGDVIGEYANQGTDTVVASVTYSLAGINAENLTLSGTADLNATGNSYNNVLKGNAGNNVLTGGYGADTFVFTGGHDTITDFSAGQGDKLDLHAYHGQAHTVTQAGNDTLIDFGNGVCVTVQNTHCTDAAFLSHIIW